MGRFFDTENHPTVASPLYTLHHTFATLWLESGENPKVLQEILGHSRISLTLGTYSHVVPHIQQDAMGRFGDRFSNPSQTP